MALVGPYCHLMLNAQPEIQFIYVDNINEQTSIKMKEYAVNLKQHHCASNITKPVPHNYIQGVLLNHDLLIDSWRCNLINPRVQKHVKVI